MRTLTDLIGRTKRIRRDRLIAAAIITVITLLIVVSLIYNAISISNIYSQTSSETNTINQVSQRSLQPSTATTSTTSAAQSPLFGVAPTQAGAALSSLYTLIGTKVSPNNPDKAMAFIQIDNEDNEVYTVGDTLPKGGKIESIDASSITVLFRGMKEKLQVPWDTLPSSDEKDNLTTLSSPTIHINKTKQPAQSQVVQQPTASDDDSDRGDDNHAE